jgi:Flp pilus assembly protein TadD
MTRRTPNFVAVVVVKRTRYSDQVVTRMRRALLVAVMLAVAVPLSADRRDDAKAEVAFGIQVARKGLWKEALFRWQKATELDPNYAEAWNDLAVGYEQMGKFDDARKAYEKALGIDKSNEYIRQNYAAFFEIYDRQHARSGR